MYQYIVIVFRTMLCASDAKVAVSHLPSVQLHVPMEVAAMLMKNLSYGDGVESSMTDLKQLVQYSLSTNGFTRHCVELTAHSRAWKICHTSCAIL